MTNTIPTPAPERAKVSDIATSLIRTWVPIGVGAAAAWIGASTNTVIPADASATIGALATAAAAASYYALARLLERSRRPWIRLIGRWMLGGQVPPAYRDALSQLRR